MPRLSAASLGLKLNLTLFFFVLLLGSATAAFILYGFQRTQDNATDRSREGLEEIGRQQVLTIASDQADLGSLQLQWAADASQMAARYLVEIKKRGGGVPFDTSRLVRSPSGVLYDPSPTRATDVVMPNFAPLTPAAQQDIIDTAALDAIFPTILTQYPGQLRGENFDAIAVTYTSVNQVTRYYPPIGLNNITAPDTDVSPTLTRLGPQNPERHTIWSVPYLDSAGQGLVITANTPVYDGDTFIGVIGIDLSITRLIGTIDDVAPTRFGFAFYIDNNGKLLQSDSFDTLQEELGRGNEQLRAVMQAMRRGEESVARITVNGQDMFVGYSPLAGIGGSFAVVASVDELTAQAAAITASIDEEANRTLSITLIAMLVIFLVGLGGETWLNRKFILRPIETLVDGTRRVARGDLNTTIPVKSEDELGILATSFNMMTDQMRARRDALEREVVERTAAQDELRALFNAMTDRVVVIDREGRLIRIAQTGGPRLLAGDDQVGQMVQDIRPPAVAKVTIESVQQALDTQQTVTVEFPFEGPDGESWLSAAYSPLSSDSVVVVVRDITDFVGAQREVARQRDELQQEVRERTAAQDELRALFAAMTERVIVVDREGNYLRIAETNTPEWLQDYTSQQKAVTRENEPLEAREKLQMDALRDAIDEQRPVTIEYPMEFNDREVWMSATLSPMSNQTALIVARDITDRINAQRDLEIRVEERTRELNTVLEVSRNLVATLDLNTLLQVIMEQTEQVCSYSRASVYLYDQGAMALLGSRVPGGQLQTMPPSFRLQTDLMGTIWDDILGPRPSIIVDVHSDEPMAVALRAAVGESATARGTQGIRSWMGVPLRLKDRVVGLLALTHEEAGFFTAHHYELVQAIANQAAVAIENAKLYEAAQQLAAVEERQKLARELHDSVSQALYGIALGAKTARTQLDRDPAKAVEPVDYVLQLAEAGLAEMRALIFELRPESLELEGLVAAMEKQVAATSARYGIKVSGEFDGEPDLSLGDKEVFYRIAQEALHNVVKHARATEATIRLHNNGGVVLEVSDNGIGFDSGASFPGHMGLVSMSERAANIGAKIHVESERGKGTTIRLSLPR